jgi:hypothetical protein
MHSQMALLKSLLGDEMTNIKVLSEDADAFTEDNLHECSPSCNLPPDTQLVAKISFRTPAGKVSSSKTLFLYRISLVCHQILESMDLPNMRPSQTSQGVVQIHRNEWEKLSTKEKKELVKGSNVHVYGGAPSAVGDVDRWDKENIERYVDLDLEYIVQGKIIFRSDYIHCMTYHIYLQIRHTFRRLWRMHPLNALKNSWKLD